ncbi:hypothetical protein LTR28_004571 [Elasticomyces elasticus]|nr:hypothetical protein LTR28_004571 [Elasticomyces elasticus]
MIFIGDLVNVTAASYISRAFHAFNKTLAIDLSVPWSNTTVAFSTIDKGGSPVFTSESLWLDAQEPALYSFGGEVSWWATWPNVTQPTVPKLWKFVPNNTGGGKWSDQTSNTSEFYGLNQPVGGVHAFGGDAGYYLGGYLDVGTWPAITANWILIPQPGLIIYNFTTNRWQNITAHGYSIYGTAHYGGAEFVPIFGPQGVLIALGGWTSNPVSLDYSASVTPMERIAIFEPRSQTWYNQTATGTIPEPRSQFCTVGVPEDNGTYEVFMYGGTSDPLYGAADHASPFHSDFPSADMLRVELNLDEIYVLSLPSFVWFKANYPVTANRYGHTYEVVGNRQLLSIGGANFARVHASNTTTPSDVFTQGLGIFDMTKMAWSSSYDPKAAAYKTPQMVKDYTGSMGPYPSSWNDARLGQLFATKGIVGGVLAIILVIGAVWLLMRRRRKKGEQEQAQYAAGQFHDSHPPS